MLTIEEKNYEKLSDTGKILFIQQFVLEKELPDLYPYFSLFDLLSTLTAHQTFGLAQNSPDVEGFGEIYTKDENKVTEYETKKDYIKVFLAQEGEKFKKWLEKE